MCLCVFAGVCVRVCAGSHRIIDTEFDDGLMVVTKGGWGAWFLVLACPALDEGVFSACCFSSALHTSFLIEPLALKPE